LGNAPFTNVAARTCKARNTKATIVSRAFSLGAGIPKDRLVDEDRSTIDIVVISGFGLQAAVPATDEQMTMRPEEMLRLKAPGVMQRLEEPCEKANSLPLSEDKSSRREGGESYGRK
jgi:hypothetical protein